MDIVISMTSELDIHHAERYSWPTEVPLTLPEIGDGVELLGHGTRTLKSKTFTYGSRESGKNPSVTNLIVNLLCD